jgi:saccharopine dehydrogenase-like NADP-dependent oxidoreductase
MIPNSTNPPDSDSDRQSRPTRLIVGCGYVGLRVASLWLAAGDRVLAVTRTAQKAAEFFASHFDSEEEFPQKAGPLDPAQREMAVKQLRRIAAACKESH